MRVEARQASWGLGLELVQCYFPHVLPIQTNRPGKAPSLDERSCTVTLQRAVVQGGVEN